MMIVILVILLLTATAVGYTIYSEDAAPPILDGVEDTEAPAEATTPRP